MKKFHGILCVRIFQGNISVEMCSDELFLKHALARGADDLNSLPVATIGPTADYTLPDSGFLWLVYDKRLRLNYR